MEFGVAAARSRDPVMLGDYAGEPYLLLPILARLLTPGATRATHKDERERFKQPIISLQYGGGPRLLARKLDVEQIQARRLFDLHHTRYAGYWDWSDRKLARAFEDGELVAGDGWRCGVASFTTEFTARNWLIQAQAAAIFRYGCLLMRHIDVPVFAPVHDAVLAEVDEDRVEREIARIVECLERASRRFLHGFTLRVDTKIIRPGERFTDPRGEKTWDFVERSLRELEEGELDVAG